MHRLNIPFLILCLLFLLVFDALPYATTSFVVHILQFLDTEASKIINRGFGIRMSWVDFFQNISNKRVGTFISDLRVNDYVCNKNIILKCLAAK